MSLENLVYVANLADEANDHATTRKQMYSYRDRVHQLESELATLRARIKSQLHGQRARIAGHFQVEAQMAFEIKELDQKNPLADMSEVCEFLDKKVGDALHDPAVIAQTYEDGVLPDNAVYNGSTWRVG